MDTIHSDEYQKRFKKKYGFVKRARGSFLYTVLRIHLKKDSGLPTRMDQNIVYKKPCQIFFLSVAMLSILLFIGILESQIKILV